MIRIVQDVHLLTAYRGRARDPPVILRKKVSRDMVDVSDDAGYVAGFVVKRTRGVKPDMREQLTNKATSYPVCVG